jgi:hypothetical protein
MIYFSKKKLLYLPTERRRKYNLVFADIVAATIS